MDFIFYYNYYLVLVLIIMVIVGLKITYLLNRKLTIRINYVTDQESIIEYRVYQGSVLCPILIIFYRYLLNINFVSDL